MSANSVIYIVAAVITVVVIILIHRSKNNTSESAYLVTHPYPKEGTEEEQANWILLWAKNCADEEPVPYSRCNEPSEWVQAEISKKNFNGVIRSFWNLYKEAKNRHSIACQDREYYGLKACGKTRRVIELYHQGRFLDIT